MSFDELLLKARGLGKDEIEGSIRTLVNDARFPAVLALMDRHHREYCRAIAGQKLANEHGKLAHCAGSVFAVETLLGSVKEILEPGQRRKLTADEELLRETMV